MKNQAFNPYLPSYEYVPDAEPYVFGDRVYIYGSHDRFNGEKFCMNDYVCWSAPVDDLADWRYEGVIYKKTDDPMNRDGSRCLYAPDVQQGPDGRYYLYYVLDDLGIMSVAVCDTPAGKYEYYGSVKTADGHLVGTAPGDIYQFDPGVLVDDDGRVYLYSGFAPKFDLEAIKKLFEEHKDELEKKPELEAIRKYLEQQQKKQQSGSPENEGSPYRTKLMDGAYFFELEQDMITVKRGPELLIPGWKFSKGTGYVGHEFFEASSMRKVNGKYYFVYSSINSHELCYAVSDRPDSGFEYGGTLVSISDIFLHNDDPDPAKGWNYPGNTHGSIIEINGQWYVFYHRQTNRHQFSRQACAEPIFIESDGSIKQAEITSCGLNGGPLAGKGEYEARIACNLRSKEGVAFFTNFNMPDTDIHPYFTQDGPDRESDGNQYIANLRDGSLAGFKYFNFQGASKISVNIRGNAQGTVFVSTTVDGEPAATVEIRAEAGWKEFSAPLSIENGVHPLFFTFKGTGSFDFSTFRIE